MADYIGERLDVAVSLMENITRSKAKNLIDKGSVTVNGKAVKSNYKIKENDDISIVIEEENTMPYPQDIPLDVVYEDECLAVINKPKGMVVHGAPGHYSDTLVNACLHRFEHLSNIDETRPGIVHRIDKDTSGLIMIAKTNEAHEFLADQLQDKTMNRRYYAVCKGNIGQDFFTVEKNIARSKNDRKKMAVCSDDEGRYAKTDFTVISRNNDYCLVECKLYTGRTHQIRVHLASCGHSLVGDLVYGKKGKINFDGQALFAYSLEFIHPKTKELIKIKAEPNEEFMALLKKLKLNLEVDINGEEI